MHRLNLDIFHVRRDKVTGIAVWCGGVTASGKEDKLVAVIDAIVEATGRSVAVRRF
jgi:hypothetical protein